MRDRESRWSPFSFMTNNGAFIEYSNDSVFKVKLETFLSEKNKDKLFIVPEANILDEFENEDIKVITIKQFNIARYIESPEKKIILTLRAKELDLLVKKIFKPKLSLPSFPDPKEGIKLKPGDKITNGKTKTEISIRAIQLTIGSSIILKEARVTLNEDAEIIILNPAFQLLRPESSVRLKKGEIHIETRRYPFSVETKYLRAGTKGTVRISFIGTAVITIFSKVAEGRCKTIIMTGIIR